MELDKTLDLLGLQICNFNESSVSALEELATVAFDSKTTDGNPTSLIANNSINELENLEQNCLIKSTELSTKRLTRDIIKVNQLTAHLENDLIRNQSEAELIKVDNQNMKLTEVKTQRYAESLKQAEGKFPDHNLPEYDIVKYDKEIDELIKLKQIEENWNDKVEKLYGVKTDLVELQKQIKDAEEGCREITNKVLFNK